MRVLLTGFSGTLGRPVARALLAAGHKVRALLHSSAIDRRDLEPGIEIVWGSLQDHDRCGEFTEGVDAVVHAAWDAKQFPREAFEAANVDGSAQLLREAIKNGAGCFVYISSIAVYGLEPDAAGGAMCEDSPFVTQERSLDVYPWTKVRIEETLQDLVREAETRLVIVRPGLLFSDKKVPAKRLVRVGSRAIALLVGPSRNHLPYIHVEDVSDMIVRILQDSPRHTIYNAVPTRVLSAADFASRWGVARGINLYVLKLPACLFTAAGLAAYRLKVWLKRRAFRPNVEYQLRTATRNVTYSAERGQTELGWVDACTRKVADQKE